MESASTRKWLVRWMYAAALAHLLVGLALPWIGGLSIFEGYHRGVEAAFWGGAAPRPRADSKSGGWRSSAPPCKACRSGWRH